MIETQDLLLTFPKREKLGDVPEGLIYTATFEQSQVRLLSYAKEGGLVVIREPDGKVRVEQLSCTGVPSAG